MDDAEKDASLRPTKILSTQRGICTGHNRNFPSTMHVAFAGKNCLFVRYSQFILFMLRVWIMNTASVHSLRSIGHRRTPSENNNHFDWIPMTESVRWRQKCMNYYYNWLGSVMRWTKCWSSACNRLLSSLATHCPSINDDSEQHSILDSKIDWFMAARAQSFRSHH